MNDRQEDENYLEILRERVEDAEARHAAGDKLLSDEERLRIQASLGRFTEYMNNRDALVEAAEEITRQAEE